MARLADIRNGLATSLAAITGLRVHKTIPDQVAVPAAIIGLPEIEYDLAMRGTASKFTIPVRIYASKASERAAQEKVDEFMEASGDKSVKQAIETDPSLAGAAHTVRVSAAKGYGVYAVGGVDYLGVEFVVEVVA